MIFWSRFLSMIIRIIFFTFYYFITFSHVNANEVTLPLNGIILNANYELSDVDSNNVILITHGGLAHRGMESIVYLQELFKERGFNTLAINLSLGLNNRHGMYNCDITHRHQNNDAVNEINAWVYWLKEKGVNQISLLGHSRGGAQTALYAAEHDNKLINSYVLMAPATRDNSNAGYQQRYGVSLEPLLIKAKSYIKEGKGEAVLKHANLMFCRDTSVTANSFISYYGQDRRLDTPSLIPDIHKPVLVVVAGNDEIVVDLEKKLSLLSQNKMLRVAIIESSGHFFLDLNADDAVEVIDSYYEEVGFKK